MSEIKKERIFRDYLYDESDSIDIEYAIEEARKKWRKIKKINKV